MKKLTKLLLTFLLATMVVACGTSNKEDPKPAAKTNEKFDTFVEELPSKMLEDTDSALNFLFADKEAFGYKDVQYEYSLPSLDEYKKSLKETEDVYKELKKFDKADLDDDQQLTYDILERSFNTDSSNSIEEDFYIGTNPLDLNTGEPGNLPTSFYSYKFRNKQDVDSYLHLMESTKEYFLKLVEHEIVRQDKGFGMTPSHVKQVLDQTKTFIDGDHAFLIETFDEKINAMDLSTEEKASYKEKNITMANVTFKDAYVALYDELSKVEVKSKDIGLEQYKGGKDYFAALIEANTGFDNLDDYEDFLEDVMDSKLREIQKMNSENSKLIEAVEDPFYTNATSAVGVVEELEEKTKEDFPALRSLDYEMPEMPLSMRKISTFAAAYFLSPVDETNSKEKMVLNDDYKQSSFTTIAHEGYPGHMYQIQYFKEQEQPIIRQLVSFDGYTEGYANYVEHYSAKYAEDAKVAKFASLYEQFTYANLLLLDLKIHNEGISREEAYEEVEEMYGPLEEEAKAGIFEQLLNYPALFSKYAGSGYRFEELKNDVKEEMGSKYSDMKFHEAILKVGPAPHDILREYVYKDLNID